MIILAIRFILELSGVVALAYLGATTPTETLWRVVMGIGAPLALIAVWALVIAPKAENPLPLGLRELLGTALLVLVAAMLAAAGQPGWGIALAAAVLVDQALLLAFHPEAVAAGADAAAARGNN